MALLLSVGFRDHHATEVSPTPAESLKPEITPTEG